MALVRNPDGSLGMSGPGGRVVPWVLGEEQAANLGLAVPPSLPTPGLTDASRGALALGPTSAGASKLDAGTYGPPSTPELDENARKLGIVQRAIDKARAAGKTPHALGGMPSTAETPDPYAAMNKTVGDIPKRVTAAAARAADAAGYGDFVPETVSREAPKSAEETKAEGEKKPELRRGARVVDDADLPGGPRGGQPQGQGGPRPHLIKGGDVRAAYKVERTNANPEDMQAAEDAEADASVNSKLAAQSLSDTSAQRSASLASRLGEQLDAEDQAVARQAAKNQAISAEYERRQSQIDQENEAIDNMPLKGAAEILGDRSAASKFMSAISLIAGGAMQGAGMTRDNPGLQMRDRAVQDAIDAQKAKRDARAQGLRVKETQLDRLTQLYGSPEAAESELRDRMDRLFERHAYQQTLDAGATDAAAKLQQDFAARDAERAQNRLKRQQALAGSITESFVNVPDHVIGGAPAVKESDVHQLSADEEKAGIGAEAADLGRTVDLIHSMPEGEVPTVGSRNILSRAARATADTIGGTGTAGRMFDTDAEHAAATKVEQIRGQLRHQLSGAAVSPTEAPILERQLQDLNTKEGLLQFASDLQRKIQRHQSGIRAGSRPEVVQEYERRKGAYGVRGGPASARGE